jgi:hypothetical protein
MAMKLSLMTLVMSFAISAGTATVADACTCGSMGSFEDRGAWADAVVLATVTRYETERGGRWMEVEVHAVLKGTEKRSSIRVYGDDGMSCMPYVTTFGIGKTYVLAMSPTGSGHYNMSSCGEYWLEVVGAKLIRPKFGSRRGPPMSFVELAKSLCVWRR